MRLLALLFPLAVLISLAGCACSKRQSLISPSDKTGSVQIESTAAPIAERKALSDDSGTIQIEPQ